MRERAMLMVRLWAIVLLFSAWLPSLSWAGGWYLMVAPTKDTKDVKNEYKPDLSWPLSLWEQRESFDSAKACEAQRMRELASRAALLAATSVAPNETVELSFIHSLTDLTEQFLLGGDSSKIPARLIGPISKVVSDFKPGYLCIATEDPRLKTSK